MPNQERAVFTLEMKETHTILVPMMLPIHFRLLKKLFDLDGIRLNFWIRCRLTLLM